MAIFVQDNFAERLWVRGHKFDQLNLVIRQKKFRQPNTGQSRFYYFFLSINVALLSLAGHYGGYLTHGEDYLTKYMPLAMKNFLNIDNVKDQYYKY